MFWNRTYWYNERITTAGYLEEKLTAASPSTANLVASRTESGDHAPALDLDVPAYLVPSSTRGHTHLYINVSMPWWKYRILLKTLVWCGIIEEGYYRASVRRKMTMVRPPWVRK